MALASFSDIKPILKKGFPQKGKKKKRSYSKKIIDQARDQTPRI